MDTDKLSKPILVSKDGYCLDGHHRWLALLNKDADARINVIEIGLPVRKALEVLRDYPRVMYKDDSNIDYAHPDRHQKM